MDDRTMIAAMALQGILANPNIEESEEFGMARAAVQAADFLIAELARTSPGAGLDREASPPAHADPDASGEGLLPEWMQGTYPTSSREERSPVDSGTVHGEAVPRTASDRCNSTEDTSARSSSDPSDGEKEGAPEPESAPVLPAWMKKKHEGGPIEPAGPVIPHCRHGIPWFDGRPLCRDE